MPCCTTATASGWPPAGGSPPVAPNSLASAPMSIPATAFQRPYTGRHTATVPTQAAAEPKPDRLMRAVALVLFTYVWRLQDAFPILGKLQLPALAVLTSLIYYRSTKWPIRRARLIKGPTTKLVVALMVIMAIGVPFSLWRGHSAMFVHQGHAARTCSSFSSSPPSVRTMRDIEWFALVNLYGALVYTTVVSLFFHVGYDGRLGGFDLLRRERLRARDGLHDSIRDLFSRQGPQGLAPHRCAHHHGHDSHRNGEERLARRIHWADRRHALRSAALPCDSEPRASRRHDCRHRALLRLRERQVLDVDGDAFSIRRATTTTPTMSVVSRSGNADSDT